MASTVAPDNVHKNHRDSFETHENRTFTSQDVSAGSDASAIRQGEASNSDLIVDGAGPLSSPRVASAITSSRTDQESKPHPVRTRARQTLRKSYPPSLKELRVKALTNPINIFLRKEVLGRDRPKKRSPSSHPEGKVQIASELYPEDDVEWSSDDVEVVTYNDVMTSEDEDEHLYNAKHAAQKDEPHPGRKSRPRQTLRKMAFASTSGIKICKNCGQRMLSYARHAGRCPILLDEARRQIVLMDDPQSDAVEEFRVSCQYCQKWIELRQKYCPINWTAHKLECSRPNPQLKSEKGTKKVKRESTTAPVVSPETSSASVQVRRTEEERIKFLLSDPHATTVEPHRILCAICRRWIQLRKNSTYCTAPWVQHVKKCVARHDTLRMRRSPSGDADAPDRGSENDSEFEDEPPNEVSHEDSPPKRGRGRPRKRKFGQMKEDQVGSFPLRSVSGAPLTIQNGAARGNGHRSISPPPLRTPSPLPNHPYSNDMYWFPTLPPMSSYYPLYAGSQYNESDDSYSMYFHAQPPAQQPGPSTAQGRSRSKPVKPRNSIKSLGWHGPPLKSIPSGSAQDPQSSPGPDGSAGPSGRTWVVWRLKNYSANSCPMDRSPVPESHPASVQRACSEVSGSSSEPLPLYRSGTWPHLLDPQGPSHTQSLSPYVHHETSISSKDTSSAPGTHSAQFGHPSAPPPKDPGPVSFNSNAHIPIRNSETYRHPPPPQPPLPPRPPVTGPDANNDSRYSAASRPVVSPVVPEPPKGIDLDSAECRLSYTFQSIAYLFSTTFQGADDMSLDTLTSFMNHYMPRDRMYDGQEVSEHVALLGERKQLIFTKEGGVQLLTTPS